jgi:hypothetical protein
MEDLTPPLPEFKYSKRKDGIVARSDGVLVPLHDESNVVTQHFRKWEKADGRFVEHVMSKDEERFEREQQTIRDRNAALLEEERKRALSTPARPIIGQR